MGKTRINVNLHMKVDTLPQLMKALRALERREVVVGFPMDKDVERRREDGEDVDITNAEIAFVQTKGDPERNLPARPFLAEGVREGGPKIADQLLNTAMNALEGNASGVEKGFTATGLVAVSAVRNKIVAGPFEKLKDSTIAARRRRGRTGIKPLQDTGQLRNAVNFATRDVPK
jgi:hypothetical protein